MADFSDRIAAIVVRAQSPDGRVFAELRGSQVEVYFVPRGYPTYREDALADQLGRLGAELRVGYRRAYLAALRQLAPTAPGPHAGAARWRQVVGINPAGTSHSGRIWLRSRALVRWQVRIDPGTLDTFSEAEFLDDLHSAIDALLTDYRTQARRVTGYAGLPGLPGPLPWPLHRLNGTRK